jgi:hypothetical protein
MASGGRLVPNAGGVLLRNARGHVVGAVGVSGDTPDMDEDCALDGIKGCGLTADAGRRLTADPRQSQVRATNEDQGRQTSC